jgi:hypothetical protein
MPRAANTRFVRNGWWQSARKEFPVVPPITSVTWTATHPALP